MLRMSSAFVSSRRTPICADGTHSSQQLTGCQQIIVPNAIYVQLLRSRAIKPYRLKGLALKNARREPLTGYLILLVSGSHYLI